MPTIIDIDAEAAKLTMFRGLTPLTKRAERKGSGAQLPRYRDGLLIGSTNQCGQIKEDQRLFSCRGQCRMSPFTDVVLRGALVLLFAFAHVIVPSTADCKNASSSIISISGLAVNFFTSR